MFRLLPLGIIAVLAMIPVAYATNESPYKWGYTNGLSDGKNNLRDELGSCENVFNNSTSAWHQCEHGYNIGFKQGCDFEATHPKAPIPEFGSCKEYFASFVGR